MRVPAVCLLSAAAICFTGCGGNSSVGGERAELEHYLNRVAVEQHRYERTRMEAVSALRHASSVAPDDTWREAASQLRQAERAYDELAGRMKAIHAPAALRSAHAGMIKSLQLYERLVQNLESPLGNRDVVAMGRTLQTTTRLGLRANVLRTRWRIAAHDRAAQVGVTFPSALDRIGRQVQLAPAA